MPVIDLRHRVSADSIQEPDGWDVYCPRSTYGAYDEQKPWFVVGFMGERPIHCPNCGAPLPEQDEESGSRG